jgi:hypothetical protein
VLVVLTTMGMAALILLMFQFSSRAPSWMQKWAAVVWIGIVAGASAHFLLSKGSQVLRLLTALLAATSNLWLLAWLSPESVGVGLYASPTNNPNWDSLGQLVMGVLIAFISLLSLDYLFPAPKKGRRRSTQKKRSASTGTKGRRASRKKKTTTTAKTATGSSRGAAQGQTGAASTSQAAAAPRPTGATNAPQASGAPRPTPPPANRSQPATTNRSQPAPANRAQPSEQTRRQPVSSNQGQPPVSQPPVSQPPVSQPPVSQPPVRRRDVWRARWDTALGRARNQVQGFWADLENRRLQDRPYEKSTPARGSGERVRVGKVSMKIKPTNGAVQEVRLSEEMEHRCPYCLELVREKDPRGVKECEICHTRHHADCWAVTGVCQVPHYHDPI